MGQSGVSEERQREKSQIARGLTGHGKRFGFYSECGRYGTRYRHDLTYIQKASLCCVENSAEAKSRPIGTAQKLTIIIQT